MLKPRQPTLRQEATLRDLPKNSFNLSKTMRQNGYAESSINSGTVRNQILKNLDKKKYFDEDSIRKEYRKTLKEASKAEDLTNKLRTLEGMARIEALFTDKSIVNNQNPDKVIVTYGNNPIHKPSDTNKIDKDSEGSTEASEGGM